MRAAGPIAIFLCLDYMAFDDHRRLWIAIALLPAALVFDILDGYVARLNPARQSVLGADLDSLSDVISFGVGPAVLGYTLGLRGGWDMVCLTFFVVCGVSRLARFNATATLFTASDSKKVEGHFGTPIPTSILIVGLLALMLWNGHVQQRCLAGRRPRRPDAAPPARADLPVEWKRDDQQGSHPQTVTAARPPRRSAQARRQSLPCMDVDADHAVHSARSVPSWCPENNRIAPRRGRR